MEHNIFITRLSDIINERYIIDEINKINFTNKLDNNMIKWVGSKQSCSEKIFNSIKKLNEANHFETYIEPFVGSGSILKTILEYNPKLFKKYYINDINPYISTIFKIIKNKQTKELIELLKEYELIYNSESDKETLYYIYRDIFNEGCFENDLEMVSLFMFINKTSFRGLYRVNKDNKFNVPYGNYKKISFNYDELNKFEELFSKIDIEIYNLDYIKFLKVIKQKSFIYLDPPYLNTFDSYCQNGFDSELFKEICKQYSKNNQLLISNSEDFIIESFKTEIFEIQQKINSKLPGSKRIERILWNEI